MPLRGGGRLEGGRAAPAPITLDSGHSAVHMAALLASAAPTGPSHCPPRDGLWKPEGAGPKSQSAMGQTCCWLGFAVPVSHLCPADLGQRGSHPSLKPLPPPELGEMGPTHLPIEHVKVRPSLGPPSTQSVPVLCCCTPIPAPARLGCPQSLSWGGGPADGNHWKQADLEGPVPPWPLQSRTRTELVLSEGLLGRK